MINEIVSAIVKALDTAFNAESDAYEIYNEEIKQDLREPAFFVQCINAAQERALNNRYNMTNQFVVQYFPSDQNYQAECAKVAEQLFDVLEYVTCIGDNKPIWGTGMKFEVVDGVLNFSVNYDLPIRRLTETSAMEKLESHVNVKEGE